MDNLTVFLHGENAAEARLVEVPAKATIEEIITIYKDAFGHTTAVEEIFIFHENEEHHQPHHAHHQFHHHKHVHAHRCKKITLSVSYNGQVKTLELSPSTTGQAALEKSADKFGITPIDAANLLLELGDKKIIQSTSHIGSFVSHHDCSLAVFLVPNPQIKG